MARRRSAVVLACALAVPALAATTGTAHATPAAHKASLTLTKTSALPGVRISFHGQHFRAREQVVLHWGSARGRKLATVTASRSGAISGHLGVPNPTQKVHLKTAVVAVGSKDHKLARASFRQQCTDEWAASSGGDWSNAKRWSTGVVPGASDIACITRTHKKNYTVALSGKTGSTTVRTLIVGSPTGKRTETLKILPDGSDLHLDLATNGLVERHGDLALGMTKTGGNVFIDGGPLHNSGEITTPGTGWSRYFSGNVVNERSGHLIDNNHCAGACDVYFDNPGSFTNLGTLTVDSQATVITGGVPFTQTSGSVHNEGAIILNAGTLTLTKGTVTGVPWLLRNGMTLLDHGANGTYVFQDTGSFNGNVPAGQTVTVDGDAGSDVTLAMPAAVTNNGTINLTSDAGYNGQTNSWLVPQSSAGTTLTNTGLLETTGSGWSRYFEVNITNAASGRVVLGDAVPGGNNYLIQAQGAGSTTFTNDGSLTIADGADLLLSGTSYGQADFLQTSTGTLHMTNDTTHSTQSLLHQLGCSAGGCQNESMDLGGTLSVATVGSAGSFTPIYSDAYAVGGSFASIAGSPSYSAAYDGPDAGLSNPPGDVILTPTL